MTANALRRRAIQTAAGIAVLAACGEATRPDGPSPVATVELSTSSLTLGPTASVAVNVVLRDANGSTLAERSVVWSVADPGIASVSGQGVVTAISFGSTTIRAEAEGKFAEAEVLVVPTEPAHLAGAWLMDSFNGKTVPAAYVVLLDQDVDGRVIERVEIRLDSATKTIAANALYQRRYWFTELHDGVPALKYFWGDHGRMSLGTAVPVPMTLTSDYIQNLWTAGHVASDGRLTLDEALWIGEELHETVWSRRP